MWGLQKVCRKSLTFTWAAEQPIRDMSGYQSTNELYGGTESPACSSALCQVLGQTTDCVLPMVLLDPHWMSQVQLWWTLGS